MRILPGAQAKLPTGQVIARNSHHKFEKFNGVLASEGQNWLHLWKTCFVRRLRPVENSPSGGSDHFLAVGAVTQSDRLAIELVQRPDTPAAILIKWPSQPTVTRPAELTATIAAIMRVLGTAQIEMAARRAAGL